MAAVPVGREGGREPGDDNGWRDEKGSERERDRSILSKRTDCRGTVKEGDISDIKTI